MKFRSNAHTHSTYCDGVSSISETIEAAKRLGFVSLGFSGHGWQGFDYDYSMTEENQAKYIAELREAQRQCAGVYPRLWAGVEEDAFTPAGQKARNRRELDYVLSSTHYVAGGAGSEAVAVDGDILALRHYVDEACGGDSLEMVRRYYRGEADYLLADKPDIIGHFDLVRKYAVKAGFFDPESEAYRRLALDALERAFPCGGVLEVNTGAMARGTMTEPYPTLELLCAWREMGGKVTLTSDCHDAAKLDYGFDQGLRLIARAGYAQVWRLGAGDELWEAERVKIARAR